jgi:hypothetical protein
LIAFKNIRNCGKLSIEFGQIEGIGKRTTKKFLTTLLEKIIENAIRYYDNTSDSVFSYRERQLDTVICPAIADQTLAFLTEHPLKRKPSGEDEYPGFVDYWASFNGVSYLMEIKQAYYGYKSGRIRASIPNRFSEAIDQLRDVRKETCEDLCQGDKNLFKIALEAITFFRSSFEKKELIGYKTVPIINAFQRLKTLNPLNEGNMHALWLVDRNKVEPYDYTDSNGTTKYIPLLGL